MQSNEEATVLARIYDAAVQPARWQDALAAVGQELGAQSAFFFSTHSDTQPDAVIHTHNQPAEMVEGFTGGWYLQDEWAIAARASGRMQRGTLVLGQELVAPADFQRSPFFADFCRSFGIGNMIGSVLFDGSEADRMPFVNLCWYRPSGEAPFGAAEKERLQRLLPHFQRALRIQRRVAWATDGRAALALNALRVATLVLDGAGGVRHRNAAAEGWLRSLPAGSYQFGKLRAIGRRSAPGLAEALAACTPSHPVRLAALTGDEPPTVLRATLLGVGAEERATAGADAGGYLLLVELPDADTGAAAQTAADLFALSPAETRVLGRLLAGAAPAEIARQLGTSLPTVRTQMSSVFAKTGTSGQVELLLLLRQLAR